MRTRRIGPKMLAAQEYVQRNPGCTKHEASIAVGPHNSNAFGYRTVERALAAGLIRADFNGRRYFLYAAE